MALSMPLIRSFYEQGKAASANLHRPLHRQPTTLTRALTVAGAAALSAVLSRTLAQSPDRGKVKIWYDALHKPAYTPPKKAFGPVWALLYATSAYSAFRVWSQGPQPARQKALGLWVSHLGCSTLWSRLFFEKRLAYASLADITADLGAATAFTYYAARTDKLAGALAAPLAVWLALATLLNEEIVRQNRTMFR